MFVGMLSKMHSFSIIVVFSVLGPGIFVFGEKHEPLQELLPLWALHDALKDLSFIWILYQAATVLSRQFDTLAHSPMLY